MRTPTVSPTPCHRPEVSPVPSHPARGGAPTWEGLSPIGPLAGLAPAARRRLHEANVQARWRDVDRYEAYLDRYLEGARRCRTSEELRAYGRPIAAGEGLEPDGTTTERAEFMYGPSGALRSRLYAAHRELGDLILRLERRPVPLDAFFDVSVTARLELGGRSFGGSLSARGAGAVEAAMGGVAGVAAGQGRQELGLDAGIAQVRASFAGGRVVGVELSIPAAPGVTVHAKRTRGAVEHGVSVGAAFGGNGKPGVRVEARASVGVTLVTPELVRRGLFGPSFFDAQE